MQHWPESAENTQNPYRCLGSMSSRNPRPSIVSLIPTNAHPITCGPQNYVASVDVIPFSQFRPSLFFLARSVISLSKCPRTGRKWIANNSLVIPDTILSAGLGSFHHGLDVFRRANSRYDTAATHHQSPVSTSLINHLPSCFFHLLRAAHS